MKSCFFILLLPIALFGKPESEYARDFSEYFQQQKIVQAENLLNEWELEYPQSRGAVLGMRAAVHLVQGHLQPASALIDEALVALHTSGMDPDSLEFLEGIQMHIAQETTAFTKKPRGVLSLLCDAGGSYRQPKGVTVRYWVGVGEIIVGMLIFPYSPTTAKGLIATGVGTVLDAGTEAWDNKEAWEKELRARQQIEVR